MNPFILVVFGVGIALALSYGKTIKAGLQLDWGISKFQLYKINLKELVFRLTMKFANSNNTPLKIQMISVKIYIDAVVAGGQVTNTGKLIGSLDSDTIIEIPANKISEIAFYPTMPTAKLLLAVGQKVYDGITGTAADMKPQNVLISGFIKVEGVKINITNVIPFSL